MKLSFSISLFSLVCLVLNEEEEEEEKKSSLSRRYNRLCLSLSHSSLEAGVHISSCRSRVNLFCSGVFRFYRLRRRVEEIKDFQKN
jgi:hypothetical protein